MTAEEIVKAKYPNADLGVSCSKYRAWFRIIDINVLEANAKANLPWYKCGDDPTLGSGMTVKLAWEDAASRLK